MNTCEGDNMKYGIAKKLCILLKEYAKDKDNSYLEDDLIKTINEISRRDYFNLLNECLEYLEEDLLYECLEYLKEDYHFDGVADFKNYLEYLPVQIGENRCERGIARAEKMREYEYENGYDEVMRNGYDF